MDLRTTCQDYGDAATLVTISGGDAEARWRAGQHLAAALRREQPPAMIDVAASYASVLVSFDPLHSDHDTIAAAVATAFAQPAAPDETNPARLRLPVVFGGEYGPDLDDVAAALGTGSAEVVAAACATAWTVRFLGSPAGAPMLDGHDRFASPIARRPDPRTHLPAGSVGLSGQQCVIYPVVSPGGWQLIGRTPATMFDLRRDPITDLRPGDLIDLVAIDAADWDANAGALSEYAG